MSQIDARSRANVLAANVSGANASWMEHQILDHVKCALRVTLEWKVPAVGFPRKLSSVKFMIKSFQRHLDRVMRLEESDGYMRVVAERKPNLDENVACLCREHQSFRRQMAQLVSRIEVLTDYDATAFDEVCAEIGGLLDAIDRHDTEEIRLLQESMLSDEGGEG